MVQQRVCLSMKATSGLTIRPMQAGEGALIVELHALPHVRDLLVPPTVEQAERAFDHASVHQWIVLDDDERVGMIMFAQLEPWLFELRRMIARYEGRGIGRFAFDRAVRHIFEERGAHRAYLEVHARNARARSLYERYGFIYEGTYRDGAQNPMTGAFEDLCIYGMLEHDYRRLRSGSAAPPPAPNR